MKKFLNNYSFKKYYQVMETKIDQSIHKNGIELFINNFSCMFKTIGSLPILTNELKLLSQNDKKYLDLYTKIMKCIKEFGNNYEKKLTNRQVNKIRKYLIDFNSKKNIPSDNNYQILSNKINLIINSNNDQILSNKINPIKNSNNDQIFSKNIYPMINCNNYSFLSNSKEMDDLLCSISTNFLFELRESVMDSGITLIVQDFLEKLQNIDKKKTSKINFLEHIKKWLIENNWDGKQFVQAPKREKLISQFHIIFETHFLH